MTTQPDPAPRRRIVVGIDGSDTSGAALRGVLLSRALEADLLIVGARGHGG
jgi:nucleotide-binding universal stress UspA family protein